MADIKKKDIQPMDAQITGNENRELLRQAVAVIKTAILQSQQRALQSVNQEQLVLYYSIGRFISANTRNKNWGTGFIESLSEQLRKELPDLRGFSAPSMRKMRTFFEEWRLLSANSFVETNNLEDVQDKTFLSDFDRFIEGLENGPQRSIGK